MPLNEYRKKRDFKITSEPSGEKTSGKHSDEHRIYVIQKHRATALHYDFRLEYNGTLLSWAVPKGPSLDPSTKRLAMQVEDHPIDYADFEGTIPEGEYGGGTVMVWDKGTWTPESPDVDAALQKGDLKFALHGKKLQGPGCWCAPAVLAAVKNVLAADQTSRSVRFGSRRRRRNAALGEIESLAGGYRARRRWRCGKSRHRRSKVKVERKAPPKVRAAAVGSAATSARAGGKTASKTKSAGASAKKSSRAAGRKRS